MEELNIYQIQGEGSISPFVDQSITVTGIVTGDFQNGDGDDSRNLGGFYLQDAMGDDNPLTSDGIFVFEGDLITDVNVGNQVTVNGTVAEFFGETQIRALTVTITGSGTIEPTFVPFPLINIFANSNDQLIADFEPYEGMLVTLPDTLSVTEFFNLDRFGEIKLAQGGRAFQFTNQNAPSVEGFAQENEDFGSRTIMLDDGLTSQNPDPIIFPAPSLASDNTVRIGDTVTNLTGNIRFSRGSGGSGEEIFRLMPTVTPEFVSVNQRPLTHEEVGGSLKVVNFNVLNYFTTLDENDNTTGPDNTLDPRGADNIEEFNRQTEKLVTALTQLDADVIGLAELENNGFANLSAGNSITGKSAIATLVDELNVVEGADTYAFVDPGTDFLGSDAIMVGFIYNTNTVSIDPNSNIAFLTDDQLEGLGLGGSAPLFDGFATSRVPLATTFVENATGEKFTAVINHLKSKGSSGLNDVNDPNFDQGDGQGFWNQRRLESAQAIDAWLQTDPTNSGDTDVLIMGDLNSYLEEAPITFLENQGYENLLDRVDNPYSFVFSGRSGSLDQALASGSLANQVTGITEWHINADEPDALDYNLDFGRNPDLFDGSIPFRVSDHDPVIVGLNLQTLDLKVASGDVDQDSAVLWTRSNIVGDVTFTYATDADFNNIVDSVSAPITDITIPAKVTIENLQADTTYYYQVENAQGAVTGRFQTFAPLGEFQGFNFGVTGDWRGELAPYPAIANVAEKELDLFVLHGDTIYADYGSDAVLNADGSRKEQSETLEDFRAKHNEVYSERFGFNYWGDVRRSTSVIATIDDHEVINDFAGGEMAATDERFPETEGLINDTALYENGLQAFQEYNPLEDRFYGENTGDGRFDGERELYRYNTYGSDAAIMMIDTRSFRDQALPSPDFNDPAQIQATLLASLTQDRTLLGSVQLENLKNDLLDAHNSGITWKFLMIPEPMQNILPGITVDSYEGYGKERTELLQFIEDNNIQNVVFVAADVHTTYVNNITYQTLTETGLQQNPVPVFEITTGSVAFDQPTGEILAGIVLSQNPELAPFYNSLPINPDPTDSAIPDDKDDFVEQAINAQVLAGGGFDPLGLDVNLPTAEGLIDAQLLQGDYYVGHTFGWSEFDIDAETQALTITTYGIDAYSEEELLNNSNDVLNRQPRVVSEFVVNPNQAPVIDNQSFNITAETVGVIGNIEAVDPNANQQELLKYTIDDPSGKFAIDENNGTISLVDNSNLGSRFTFDITVTDPANLATTATITVNMASPLVGGSALNDNLDSAFGDNGFTGSNQLLFTGSGMDTVDISQTGSNSRIDTGSGDDIVFAGTNNRIILGDGDDKLFISTSGGGNRVTGGRGADQFWLYTDEGAIPNNPNIISDFNPAEDVIGFLNTTLSLGSSDFSYNQDGSDVMINAFGQNVGILLNTTIADSNFVFA